MTGSIPDNNNYGTFFRNCISVELYVPDNELKLILFLYMNCQSLYFRIYALEILLRKGSLWKGMKIYEKYN